MDRKRVLLIRNVAKGNFGGGEVYQLELAGKLRGAGFQPVIITNSNELLKRANELDFKTIIPPYMKNQNWSGWRNILLPIYFGYIWRLRRWYEEIFKYYKPEVINVQSRDDYLAATPVARKFGIRILWTDHADFRNWVLWNVNVRFKNVIGKKIIKLSRKVEKVIFVSKEIGKETAKMIYPKMLKNTVVIENGVNDELVRYKDIKVKKNSFVFIGRVVEEKGIKEMIEAFMLVVEKHPEATLSIYGDGRIDEYKRISRSCSEIEFCGESNNPLMVLAENEVFVLPSYREGLSLSLLDAAMMAKKIITTDVDGNMEVVEGGKTGILVPVKNVEKLAEAMIWMIEHKKEAENMAKSVRKRYEKKFDFKRIFSEKMLPLYNNKKEVK